VRNNVRTVQLAFSPELYARRHVSCKYECLGKVEV
jgi:hypothetical protein